MVKKSDHTFVYTVTIYWQHLILHEMISSTRNRLIVSSKMYQSRIIGIIKVIYTMQQWSGQKRKNPEAYMYIVGL
jgi:hypothetical protein